MVYNPYGAITSIGLGSSLDGHLVAEQLDSMFLICLAGYWQG
jgi:hypothetical protein